MDPGNAIDIQSRIQPKRRRVSLPCILAAALLAVLTACSTAHRATSEGDIDKLARALREGADVNARNEKGRTPLMTAARQNRPDIIRMLLEQNADINVRDDYLKTAIRHAYDTESIEAFRVLLENGATIDFNVKYETVDISPAKRRMNQLAREYRTYIAVKNRRHRDDLTLFDFYFSRFPNGTWSSEVERMFREVLREDFKRLVDAGNPKRIQHFIGKYARMGNKCRSVTADVLNIRAGASTRSRILGKLFNGDRVYAMETDDGWIRTGFGWISKAYTKPAQNAVPGLEPFMKAAENRLATVEKPAQPVVKRPKTVKPTGAGDQRVLSPREVKPRTPPKPASISPPPKTPEVAPPEPQPKEASPPPKTAAPASETPAPASETQAPAPETPADTGTPKDPQYAEAERKLNTILSNPTLPGLESFISKYKGRSGYYPLVNRAKEKYKEILIGE